ncbi:MAG: heme lyase CcmF/NrfE family subunit [Hyphomicrobium sp.]
MAPEIGHLALILALLIALIQSILPLHAARTRDPALVAFSRRAAVGQLGFVGLAFACLTYVFVTSDFSVATAVANSHTAKPLVYKISGVWGNHEGSMLLWVLILAIFGAAAAVFGDNLPDRLRCNALAVQGMIALGFLAFIVFTSNPFERVHPAPLDGNGLNPILQDPGLAIHPPFLYLGYVGFSMAFSFSIAALIEGRVDAAWARWVRPWVLAAWCFLTIGIVLGSAWAYYTLGWGGWWFWDPVENASFMPWLAGTALLHSALVVERRNALVSWTILLGILTFSLSLLGTFLVRSGVLTSVHAFAQDPARGVFILGLLVAATGGALTLYAIRAPVLRYGAPFAPFSREGSLTLNNALLAVATGTVFIGTFYPLLIDLVTRDKISVGPPYYNVTFVSVTMPLLLVMAFGPMLRWKRDDPREVLKRLRAAGIAAAVLFAIVLAATFGRSILAAAAFAVAAWIVVGALLVLTNRIRLGRASLETSLNLARTTPRAIYGLILAHAGVGITVMGIAGMSAWATETAGVLTPGQSLTLAGYEVGLKGITVEQGPNYEAQQGRFEVTRNGRHVTSLVSERRFYPVREQLTTHAGIRTNLVSNIYVTLGDPVKAGGHSVRLYHHPFVPWIWIGGLIMALGGFVSLSDRRWRIGLGETRHAAVPVPAE